MRISLRGQILLYTLTALFLAVGTLAFITLNRETVREKEQASSDYLYMTESFAAVVLSDGYLQNKTKLKTLINTYLVNKHVISVEVYDAEGKILAEGLNSQNRPAHFKQDLHAKPLHEYEKSEAYFNKYQIEVVCPLKGSQGKIDGYLRVSYSLSELEENLNVQFYDILIAVLICFIFALCATIMFSSWIIQPLRELMDKANRIIQGENVPLTLDRQDEIGSLALSLNTMLRSINTRDDKLRQLAASLELKVIQRTEELEKALKRAEDATQAKANFLASMTHELRTPMNGVIGTASLLADTHLTPLQAEQLNIIRNCGDHLLTVINDILDFSKIEASKMELDCAPLDLRKVVDDALNIVRPMVATRGLELETTIDEDVPNFIEGDAGRLRQILVNLLSNATKFTEKGGVYVTVKAKNMGSDKPQLEFSVRDTGIGIEPEVQQKLFTAFTQADSSTTRKYGGTGLGLVICKKLIELMGGQISIDSRLGEGATFTFNITARPTDQVPAENLNKRSDNQIQLALSKQMRILLAEDNQVNQMVAKGFLEKLGYHPDVVNNGREALEALDRKDYDLIFMDMMMPEMDGLEATRVICAKQPAHQRPWIVAMTANALEEHKQQCLEAGMNAFLTKPFTLKNLEEVLMEAPCVINHSSEIEQPEEPVHSEATVKKVGEVQAGVYTTINREKIFDNFKDDEDLVPFAIEAFMKDYPERIKDIEDGIKNDNVEKLAIAAHTLKGAVSNFFAPDAVGFAATLEKNAKEHNMQEANENFELLKSEMQKVHKELEQLLAETSNQGSVA